MNIKITRADNRTVETRAARSVQEALDMLRHCSRCRWSEAASAVVFEVVAPHPDDVCTYVVYGDASAVDAVVRAAKARIGGQR